MPVKPAVLVTKRIYPEAIDYLSQHCEVDYNATDNGLPSDQLLPRLRGKQAVVSQLTDKFTPDVIAQLEGIRIISNVAVGFDNVNVPVATEAGILVANTPDVLTDTTADMAFTLLLAAARRLIDGYQTIQNNKWNSWGVDFLVGVDAHHATLGIVGMGRIGQAVARRGKGGFSMRILYSDARRAPEEVERELDANYVPLEQLLRESDFVSLHVPLSEGTRHLIGAEQLKLMKPTAVLVNSSRGPVVDEEALVAALRDGVITAAGLDVFEREPEVHPGLLKLPQAVLAPHLGSATAATRRKMCMVAVENAVAALQGKRPAHLVNAELWERAGGPKAT